MRKVWSVELLLEVDDESCTEVIEFVENKLTAGEEYVACHVNRVIPVPPLGQQPAPQPMLKYDTKYGLKRLGIDLLEETDPHTLGKQTHYIALEKALNTVRMAPLASTIRHPRHRAKADRLCRELGKMWLDEILYHFEKQEDEDFMQKLKEVDDENKDSFAVVDRVWDGEEGIHPTDALSRGIKIDCWFIRKDGWTLGTPKEHIESAAELWQDEWREVLIMEDNVPAIRLTYEEWRTVHNK